MNNTQTGGLEAHRANALALRLEMGLPVTGTTSAAITFGGIETVTWPILEAALFAMNLHGRISCCGAVSQYDSDAPTGPRGVPGFRVFNL